jgi:hypothetical protein
LGEGNDGATGGKKIIISIPTAPQDEVAAETWAMDLLGASDFNTLTPEETVFVEGVEHHGTMRIVQARVGPRVCGIANFIPKDTEVKNDLPRAGGNGPYGLGEAGGGV